MRSLTLLLLAALPWSATVSAKHGHDDEKHWKEHQKHENVEEHFDRHSGRYYFQPREMRVITEYYAPQRRSLPPGLQKKLYRGGHLPPGWEGRIEPLPVAVERQLVTVPVGYRRGFIDGYAVVYSPRTRVVIDVFAVFGSR